MSSSVGDEVPTVTSEDFGFKKLGQANILPSFNEKLPFASLRNLDISNEKGLYIASSGGKVVIGDLQSLRDFIQNQKDTTISFRWEKELTDVIMVKFLSVSEALVVCKDGAVYTVGGTNFDSFKEAFSFAKPLLQVDEFQSGELLAITTENELFSAGVKGASGARKLASGIVSFDLLGNRVYSLMSSNSIKVQRLAGDRLESVSTLETPAELEEEFEDQYRPLLIRALNKDQVLVVYGEEVSESSEDVMYDHKMFIVSLSAGTPTFSESFDITPAFGSILRYPTSYNLRLDNLISNDKTICILASACSSEVTVWDSAEVVQPTQDSERAVLPISKETDNDTNPVGMALDISTSGNITDPCQGVDSVERLPLIYILNNEGSLQIVGLYHSSAIKNGTFKIPDVPNFESISDETINEGLDTLSKSEKSSTDTHQQSKNTEEITADTNPSTENSGTVGASDGKHTRSTFGTSTSNSATSEPAFGQASFGKPENKSAFGTTSLGNTDNKLPFGTPSFGNAANKPLFGSSSFGNSENKQTFGSLSMGNADNKSPFGTPSFGNAGNKPLFGSSSFGNSENKQTFGSPSMAKAENKSTFGTPSFGNADNKSPFGKQTFGTVSQGNTDNKSTFGTPSFGNAGNKPLFGSSSFGNSENKQTFGSLSMGNADNKSPFGTPSFGNAGNKPLFGSSSFGNSENKQTFGSPSMAKAENKSTFGTPSFGNADNKSPFGKQTFGTVSQGNTDNKSTFGTPSFGNAGNKPLFGSSSFGNSENKQTFGSLSMGNADNKLPFGTPSFGNAANKPLFGSSSFGNSENKQTFGSLSMGNTDNKSPFSTPSFGNAGGDLAISTGNPENSSTFSTPTFGKEDNNAAFGPPALDSSAFGTQGFGSAKAGPGNKPASSAPSFRNFDATSAFNFSAEGNSQSKPSLGSTDASKEPESKEKESKPAFGTVSFASGTKSPFGGLSSGYSTSGALEQQKTSFNTSSFSKFAGQNPFTSPSNSKSPFAHLSSDTEKSSPLQLDLSSNTKSIVAASNTGDRETARIFDSKVEGLESSEDQVYSGESDEGEGSERNDVSEEETDSDLVHGNQPESDLNDHEDSESLTERKGENDTELSDSTIEQATMSQLQLTDKKDDSKPSISAITARIKEGANITTSDLKFTQFGDQNSTQSPSPFTAFTGDLKKASSPGFTFANISSFNNKSDKPTSEESSANGVKKSESPSSEPGSSPEKINKKEKESNVKEGQFSTNVSAAEDKSVAQKAFKDDEKADTSGRLSDHESDIDDSQENPEGQVNPQIKDKELLSADEESSQAMKRTSTVKRSGSEENHSSGHPDSSGEESYDALDDVLPEELEEAMKREKQEAVLPSTSDKATLVKIDKNVEYASQGIQTFEAANSATQTEDPVFSDFAVNSFMNDESYCALQNMPKPLPQYFTGANITAMKYSSQDSTMRSIEKTFQVVSSELAVWQENAESMEKFLTDQSTSQLKRRTMVSLPDVYTWRISESQQLQNILSERSDSFNACAKNIEELQDNLSASLKTAHEFERKLEKVKNDYYQCETTNANPRFAGLKYHQLEMQGGLRQKMSRATEKLDHIEEMLQILKLFTVESEQIGNNAYVHKLARDLGDRDNLCNEITRLREQVDDLVSRKWPASESSNPSKDCAISTQEVQSIPVAELSLKLSTKMQIGAFLKKR